MYVGIKGQITSDAFNAIDKFTNSDPLAIISKYLRKADSGPNLKSQSNLKSSEAFSGGGAWDEEDDTIDNHESGVSSSLHKIYATVESFENNTENVLEIAFGHQTTITGDAKYEMSKITEDFIPKHIKEISGIIFEYKQASSKTNLNLNSSLDQPSGDINEKTASAALKGFMPFAEDPDKQSRYIKYLRFCHDKSENVNVAKFLLYSDEREREEFIMSAQIFKPTSSIISSRFEFSTVSLLPQIQLKPGLTRPDIVKKLASTFESTSPQSLERRTMENLKNPTNDLGRVSYTWIPNSLLCKRFNVAPPDLGVAGTIESKAVKPVLADELAEQLMSTFRKDSKINIQFDSNAKSRDIREDCVPSLPSNDLFDEIFGSRDLTTKANPQRAKASDYFGED